MQSAVTLASTLLQPWEENTKEEEDPLEEEGTLAEVEEDMVRARALPLPVPQER